MTIFTRDYSHRLRHSKKKQDNNAVKTETIVNTRLPDLTSGLHPLIRD